MRLVDADALDTVIIQLNENGWGITRNEYKLIDNVLFEMPTIEPQRTGRWMPTEPDEPCFYRCSECGRLIDERENFCPNCGASMGCEEEE